MRPKLPVVLIGPFSTDLTESVTCVNRAFVQSLADQYTFVPLVEARKYGAAGQGMLNGFNTLYFFKHFVSWLMYFVRNRPDIAHYAVSLGWPMIKGLVFMRLARFFGAKTVAHLHSGAFLDCWRALPEWRKRIALHQLKQLDGVVVLSEFWRESMANLVGIRRERLFVVNNPIDKDFEEAALQMPIDRQENIVLALGVMERKKGVMDLLQAAEVGRRRAGFSLKLVGPEREPNILKQIRQYVAAHSLSEVVDIKPGLWGQEKVEMFRKAAILVLPSYFESFPLVVLEAAAAGLPIITTPVGAVPEFFKDGVSALFIEPGNVGQMAEAIVRLVEKPDERRRLGRAARETFCSRLARSRIMGSLDGAYRRVLNVRSDDLQLPSIDRRRLGRYDHERSTDDGFPIARRS